MSINSKIIDIIIKNGYITIDDIISKSLHEYSDSYYKSIKNIGDTGDFITAPEISQLFGEIIALWAIEKWHSIGSPSKFILLEAGPGQGRLINDFLRIAKLVPVFFESMQIYILEINPYFMEKQKNIISQYNKNVSFIEDISKIPDLPTIIIANEFFDALPVKQYIKKSDSWRERVITIDKLENQENKKAVHCNYTLKYSTTNINNSINKNLSKKYPNATDGAIIEESPKSLEIVSKINKHIVKNKGAALVIDYGYNISPQERGKNQYNSTLQAIKNHKYSNELENLGNADLTYHVDFYSLSQKCDNYFIYSQRNFLLKYGIELRLQTLKQNQDKDTRIILDKQFYRLTDATQMGVLFKVLDVSVS